ncbi:MAG: hypothetical protein M1817_002297 [Caeruleum heppii]|nr:MAG: hypothetical protein M1817_003519 [Caeruleum heppii]KAI9673660.1 MAG: hypothetical protein M1817_002297 [Caeruleum heppii]
MPYPGIQIGIEVELILTAKKLRLSGHNLTDFSNKLARFFNARATADFPRMYANMDKDAYPGVNIVTEWSVTGDGSLPKFPDREDKYALEIVSPIFFVMPGEQWRRVVQNLWTIVAAGYHIKVNQACGLHVHFSPPGHAQWQLQRLQSLCRSILFFESAFEAVYPIHRRDHRAIKELMSPDTRLYAWNFQNLENGPAMTVEWRRGPGVINADECLSWTELVISFVRAATEFGSYENLRTMRPNVESFKAFLTKCRDDLNEQHRMAPLFTNVTTTVTPVAMEPLSKQALEKLRSLESEKKKKKSLMVRKVEKAQELARGW